MDGTRGWHVLCSCASWAGLPGGSFYHARLAIRVAALLLLAGVNCDGRYMADILRQSP